ncbi:MAG TPA: ABC transporter permease [Thermoanaerobaculia bacterium]|nr:ABC transporter permease [Thermoanaerobaculia bacterium]
MFFENVKIALRAIGANKMRSILTTLGVMIGVAAVIAVVSLVQGMQYKLSEDLQSVGTNYIEVFPDAGEGRGLPQKLPELTIEDAEAVQKATPTIKDFTPLFMTNVETKRAETHHAVQLMGVSAAYQDVFNHWVDRGRFFSVLDAESKKRVCVIGETVAEKLELGADPVGKSIQINDNGFTVVGVMEKKGGSFGQDRDDVVFIPFTTAESIWGPENMKRLILAFQMRNGSDLDQVEEQTTEILRTRHHLKKDQRNDFRVLAQEEILKMISKALTTTSVVMGAVVGIALLVGGIGIMNIMLVSVTERTREIGVRKAIGARRADVMLQFLIEAVVLSGLGGGIGVAGGYLLANVARLLLKRLLELPPVHTPLWAIAIAFGFCAVLGIIFGIYPAAKASKLDPIDALRYE